jgi:aryl-alcohol dehydrogenase-like predicted oxidoreductase
MRSRGLVVPRARGVVYHQAGWPTEMSMQIDRDSVMKKRTLGKSGLQVSEIGLGCWQLGGDFGPMNNQQAQEILEAADQAGIDFWDTADVYGMGLSESRIEQYLSQTPASVSVATKVGRAPGLYPGPYSKEKVRANIAGSAVRLGVETIDLVQLHCVPPDVLRAGDILAWMEDFQKEGLVRAFGASVETLEEALMVVSHPALTSLQIIFNVLRQNAIEELFPAAQANDVGIIVRLPLASGILGGRMSREQSFAETDHRHYNRRGEAFSQGETFSGIPFETALDLVEEIRPRVPSGISMAQMAMRWILDFPAVSTVITGASRPEQVVENAGVSGLAPLSGELHEKLANFYREKVESSITVRI